MTKLLFTSEKGQAVTEFAIFLPMYLLLIFGMVFFAKGYFAKQQTVSAARFMAFNEGSDVESKTKKYFFRELKKDNVSFSSTTNTSDFENKMDEGGASGDIMNALMGALGSISGTKGYRVNYSFDVPSGLQAFLGEKANPKSKCYVDHNCWSWNEGTHGLFGLLGNALSSIGDKVSDAMD